MPTQEIQAGGDDGHPASLALLSATVAVAILYGFALVTLGTPPSASETGSQLVVWLGEHSQSVRWFVWAFTVATLPLAIMFALLRRLLPAPHRDVFLPTTLSPTLTQSPL
jgi:hypothetical protein